MRILGRLLALILLGFISVLAGFRTGAYLVFIYSRQLLDDGRGYFGENLVTSARDLPLCPPPEQITGLGPVVVNFTKTTSLAQLTDENVRRGVTSGGQWKPQHCKARHRVAILVPFRDREEHLHVFLQHIHGFLQKQLVHYGIYIIDQVDKEKFNRARLFNVGFLEATKDVRWDCMIFHDVDLLPRNTRNLYYCPVQPRHFSVSVDTLGSKLLYEGQFGGVSGMTVEQFRKANGFSNMYWGWGGEDDDMATRIDVLGLRRLRYPPEVADYTMMSHKKDQKANMYSQELLNTALYRIRYDGLAETSYKLRSSRRHPLYTRYSVTLDADFYRMIARMRRLRLPHVRWNAAAKMGPAIFEKITW